MRKTKQMQFYAGKVALVTGASSGIGKALSLQLVSCGATVIGISRSRDKQQAVVNKARTLKGTFIPYEMDISDYASCREIFETFSTEFDHLDILINNAGVGHFSAFEKMPSSDYQYILNTNLMAPLHLTHLLIDLLKKSKSARIINISSSGAFYGISFRGIYCASKAGLRVWSQALAAELKHVGIKVICVVPTSTQTKFFENTLGTPPKAYRIPGKIMEAEKLSNMILQAVVTKEGELIVSLPMRAILWASIMTPWLLRKIIQRSTIDETNYFYGDEVRKKK